MVRSNYHHNATFSDSFQRVPIFLATCVIYWCENDMTGELKRFITPHILHDFSTLSQPALDHTLASTSSFWPELHQCSLHSTQDVHSSPHSTDSCLFHINYLIWKVYEIYQPGTWPYIYIIQEPFYLLLIPTYSVKPLAWYPALFLYWKDKYPFKVHFSVISSCDYKHKSFSLCEL